MSRTEYYFIVQKNRSGKWFGHIKHRNGHILMTTQTKYSSRAKVLQMLKNFVYKMTGVSEPEVMEWIG